MKGKHEMHKQRGASAVGLLWGLTCVVWFVAEWVTHVVACLKAGSWGFLIAGAIMFPVAVVHGTGVWLGAW